jgi:hypothetical protein
VTPTPLLHQAYKPVSEVKRAFFRPGFKAMHAMLPARGHPQLDVTQGQLLEQRPPLRACGDG